MLLKIITILIVALLLYSIVFFISAVVPFISEMKMSFTGESLLDFTVDLFSHPIANAKILIDDRNPLFILGMLAATGLLIHIIIKSFSKKDYENVSDRYGVQGTSRFALNKEIFIKSEMDKLNKNKLNEIILKSMSEEGAG